MKACTKCGRRHDDVEAAVGKRLYCEDIRKFWSFVGELHREKTGHFAKTSIDRNGNWYCLRCGKSIDTGADTAARWLQENAADNVDSPSKTAAFSVKRSSGE